MNTNTVDKLSIPNKPDQATGISSSSEYEKQHAAGCPCTGCAYADFLSNQSTWQFFFTGTFATPAEKDHRVFEKSTLAQRRGRTVHHEQAIKALENHLRHCMCEAAYLEEGIGRKKKTKAGHWKWAGPAARAWDNGHRPTYVCSLENNKHNNGVHVHALIAPHEDWPFAWSNMKTWDLHQGFGRTYELRPGQTSKWDGKDIPAATKIARYMVKYCVKDTTTDTVLGPRKPYERPNSQNQYRHRNPSELYLAPWLSARKEEAPKAPVLPTAGRESAASARKLLVAV